MYGVKVKTLFNNIYMLIEGVAVVFYGLIFCIY